MPNEAKPIQALWKAVFVDEIVVLDDGATISITRGADRFPGSKRIYTTLKVAAVSAWTIASVAFDGKEEIAPFAGGQLAWNRLLREIDEVFGCGEDANDARVLLMGHDHDPCPSELKAARVGAGCLFSSSGRASTAISTPRLSGPKADRAILEGSGHDIKAIGD